MIKTIELILVATLLILSFFAGVKYSESVKNHASWLFESKGEEEIELPDLSGENNVEISVPGDSNIEVDHTTVKQGNTQQDTITVTQEPAVEGAAAPAPAATATVR